MGRRRSGGTEIPALRYLKRRVWCSSSCHCAVVNGVHIVTANNEGTLMVFIFIYVKEGKRGVNLKDEEKEGKREREMLCIRKSVGGYLKEK